MFSSKEIGRRDFLKTVGFAGLGQGCFLGRNPNELKTDAILALVGGGLGAGITAKFFLPESTKKTRRDFLKIVGGGFGGVVYELALSEFFRRRERRKEVEEFLSGWPSPPEENKEITELSLSELVALINRLEGKVPTPEEADVLLTATAYQAAQFLGESPAKAKEYARRASKILVEEDFRAFCSIPRAFACTGEFSGGKRFAFFNFSEESWEELSANEIPILSLVRGVAHEAAHMDVRRLEVFLRTCGRPEEDYGVLGRFEVLKRRGFLRQMIESKSESLTEDGLLEEEFFAEWASFRFLNKLEKAGLKENSFELCTGYPEFFQAIINLEYTLPGADWPKWWQGVMDFNRVAKLHRENGLWRFHRDLGEVMLIYMYPFLNFGEGDKAALGKLAFEAFSKTDMERLERLAWIESKEEMLDL